MIMSSQHDQGMPVWMKWSADFIQRIGFPIFMCLVMTYFCFFVLERNTKAITDLKDVLVSVKSSIDNH